MPWAASPKRNHFNCSGPNPCVPTNAAISAGVSGLRCAAGGLLCINGSPSSSKYTSRKLHALITGSCNFTGSCSGCSSASFIANKQVLLCRNHGWSESFGDQDYFVHHTYFSTPPAPAARLVLGQSCVLLLEFGFKVSPRLCCACCPTFSRFLSTQPYPRALCCG